MTGYGAYLAYPLDHGDPGPGLARLVLSVASRSLSEVSWVFDPGAAFSVAPGALPVPALRSIDLEALDRADILIAIMPSGVPTIGVPMEIQRALDFGKPIVLVTDNEASWSLALGFGPDDSVFPPRTLIPTLDSDEVMRQWPSLATLIQAAQPSDLDTSLRKSSLPVQILGGAASLPTFSYNDDAGLDLIVSRDTVLPPGQFTDIPNEIAVELPEGTWGLICGRSSTLRKLGLMIPFGVIDEGYRGPLFAGAWNMNQTPVTVRAGERVSQLILVPNETRFYQPIEARDLGPSLRGVNGFGSTGA